MKPLFLSRSFFDDALDQDGVRQMTCVYSSQCAAVPLLQGKGRAIVEAVERAVYGRPAIHHGDIIRAAAEDDYIIACFVLFAFRVSFFSRSFIVPVLRRQYLTRRHLTRSYNRFTYFTPFGAENALFSLESLTPGFLRARSLYQQGV